MKTIIEEEEALPIFWDQIPIDVDIHLYIHNFGAGEIVRHANYGYYRITARANKDMEEVFLMKNTLITLDISKRSLGDTLKRILYFKGLMEKPIDIIFRREGLRKSPLLSVKAAKFLSDPSLSQSLDKEKASIKGEKEVYSVGQ